MLRSMRWQLQIWYAGILLVAVVGIGLASFLAIQQARYHEIDSELEAAGQVLAGRLRGGPPFRGPGGRQANFNSPGALPGASPGANAPDFNPDRPPGGDFNGAGFNPDDDPAGRPPPRPEDFLGNNRPQRPDRLPRFIDLPPQFMQYHGGTVADARSFVIYRDNGEIVKQWGAPYEKANLPPAHLRPPGDGVQFHQRGVIHEYMLAGPEGTTVLAAGSVQRVDDELRSLLIHLLLPAAGLLVVGLAGGWLISRLALRPISRMADTAGSISATRLTARIDARRVPSELRQLALVLNAAFDRLEASFEQQARFTADASHELRTPLTVILTHTELALSRDRSTEEYRKTIETCFAASSRMKSLVESLLLLSHADVGELSLQPVPMDLSDVVRDNANLLTTLAGQKSISIATQLQNATLIGDPFRIGQVVANLLSNAIRYNREGGRISITTEVLLGEAVLSVSDTGAGISAEDQKHVFDRFFRADKARSRVAGGSGLGLAICKSIVDAHDGSIEVTSELGVGTTFIVRFPRGAAEGSLPMLPEKIEL